MQNYLVFQECFKVRHFMKNVFSLTDEQYAVLEKHLLAAAPENRITCSGAIAIARSHGIPAGELGRLADKLNIRISKCQLGCF